MEFGAGKRADAYKGVLPRINRLVKTAASRASENPSVLDDYIPILEYLAFRVPKAYLQLADLVLEIDQPGAKERAIYYLRCFLETACTNEKMDAWLKLANLSHSTDDVIGEVHALGEAALLPNISPETIGTLAKRIKQ